MFHYHLLAQVCYAYLKDAVRQRHPRARVLQYL